MRKFDRMLRMPKAGSAPDREEGFALVLVLLAITILSILGALALMLAASSLSGIVNMKPEDRAFQIADSATAIAHAKIVRQDMSGGTFTGNLYGGSYVINITGSTPHWTVTSEGVYVENGVTYRRKIQERVTYYGSQAFDVMKNYALFAGHDLIIDMNERINTFFPVTINSNIRAQNNLEINVTPDISMGDALTVNGNVEGVNRVDIINNPQIWGSVLFPTKVTVNGNVRSGDASAGTGGYVHVYVGGSISGGVWKATEVKMGSVQSPQYLPEPDDLVYHFLFWDIVIRRITPRTFTAQRACQPVYIPHPNIEHYKFLAMEQGPSHYNLNGDLNLSGNLSSYGSSSLSVFYAKGNINLSGFAWDQPNMKGVFVCEGNFTSTSTLKLWGANSQFQVIAMGDVRFNNSWDFSIFDPATDNIFAWSGHNIYLDLGAFAGENVQFTALNDIIVSSAANLFSNSTINYRAPDIDVVGFPIDVTINDWKELPSE